MPEVGDRKPEDENFKETMLPKEQESGQERIIQDNTHSLSNNIQTMCLQKHKDKLCTRNRLSYRRK